MSLVEIKDGTAMVSSVDIAKKFGKEHRTVLRAIRNMTCSEEFSLHNFVRSDFTNDRGKTVPAYSLTRDGFSFLCMGFTGPEASKWKEAYINAFNQMEAKLLNQQHGLEWKKARIQSKDVRRSVTDTIKDFVGYAENQGSSSAKFYYSNITKMEYSALELVEKSGKVPSNFRDTLDEMDLCFLATAEQIAKQTMSNGMSEGLHYKEIYQLVKERVNQYAETVRLPRLSYSGMNRRTLGSKEI